MTIKFFEVRVRVGNRWMGVGSYKSIEDKIAAKEGLRLWCKDAGYDYDANQRKWSSRIIPTTDSLYETL